MREHCGLFLAIAGWCGCADKDAALPSPGLLGGADASMDAAACLGGVVFEDFALPDAGTK